MSLRRARALPGSCVTNGYRNRSYRGLALDDGRARALQDASDKARNARRTISQELQRMEGTSAEGPRASRYAPLKENMRRATSRFLVCPSILTHRSSVAVLMKRALCLAAARVIGGDSQTVVEQRCLVILGRHFSPTGVLPCHVSVGVAALSVMTRELSEVCLSAAYLICGLADCS